MKTIVVFRVFKSGGGVLALFPFETGSPGHWVYDNETSKLKG